VPTDEIDSASGAAADDDEVDASAEPMTVAPSPEPAGPAGGSLADRLGRDSTDKLPIKMMSDRILVRMGGPEGERRSTGGILIPATAQMGKRLTWAEVVAVGPNVRQMETGDHVLFNPEDRYEVEVRGEDFVILRERDVHAVASSRLEEGSTGLYL
jgi:chaperonin GroES